MSEMTFNIIDNSRTVSGYAHGFFVPTLLAALASEPENIAELEAACERFRDENAIYNPFAWFYNGPDHEPYDAGIIYVDLAARLIGCDSAFGLAAREGTVDLKTSDGGRFPLPYAIPPDWTIEGSVLDFRERADQLRERRASNPRAEVRPVLYGDPLYEFILNERELYGGGDDEDLLVDVHARWLMTARSDLAGQTPREALLDGHEFVQRDLHSRELQWSFTGYCPPPLDVDSEAYRLARFGANEIFVYHDFVRYLVTAAFVGEKIDIEELRAIAADWMTSPNPEYAGRVPNDICESDRRRINLTANPSEVLIDEDCEICQMMAAEFDTPMFWGLDGSSMEFDRFEFSLTATREEWEEDQRRFESFSREFEERHSAAKMIGGDPF